MGNIEATRAQVVATGNPGCMIQINFGARQRELPIQALHPVQLLDEAYRVGGAYTVPAPKSHNREVLIGLGIGAALVAAAVLLSRSKPRRG